MTAQDRQDESQEDFVYLSNEYSQAVQALETLRAKGTSLVVLGNQDELSNFFNQFVVMAQRSVDEAKKRNATRFVEWFRELIENAEALRTELMR